MPITDQNATHDELAAYRLGWRDGMEKAARIARDGCLVPPDGGSPTDAEREICDEISARILAAI